eukprot:TRINITY_DN1784_c0_g1_i2.p1 TRINITY_DN1784_c0_g1~~TRINITY_DN1784_c0_g1_i2.p1  ORF type:complete len:183 (+),score=12.68 TRINITY_DN1784_c0_g1_i2:114-662(+)
MACCSTVRAAAAVSPVAVVRDATTKSSFSGSSLALPARPSRFQQPAAARLQIVAMAGHAGGVEPDLSETTREPWLTAGEEIQKDGTFKFGKIDGAHAYHDGDDGDFFENLNRAIEDAGGPTSTGQKGLAASFLPIFIAGLAFGVPVEWYFGFTIFFIFAYCGIEMGKPSKHTHYEPDMYKVK